MANTSAGLGAFTSGMANGLKIGMDYEKMQSSAELAKAATEKQQAEKSSSAGGSTPAPGLPSLGQQPPANVTPATAQPAQSSASGSPWSFIGSMFGGSNG